MAQNSEIWRVRSRARPNADALGIVVAAETLRNGAGRSEVMKPKGGTTKSPAWHILSEKKSFFPKKIKTTKAKQK